MRRVLLIALLALLALPVSAQSTSKAVVDVQTAVGQPSVAAGSTFAATVTLAIRSGYHINAEKPTEDYLIGTKLTLTPPAGISVAKTIYPAADYATFKFSETPLAVALVTSHGSAAYHDFVATLGESGWGFRVLLLHAAVQGRGAEREVVSALEEAGRSKADCVVLVRGGGARSDLAVFDRLEVAEAVARCPLPVLTGLGPGRFKVTGSAIMGARGARPIAETLDLDGASEHVLTLDLR